MASSGMAKSVLARMAAGVGLGKEAAAQNGARGHHQPHFIAGVTHQRSEIWLSQSATVGYLAPARNIGRNNIEIGVLVVSSFCKLYACV